MNTSSSRFKITALIQMARTTENLERRERYIAQAEEELEKMSSGAYQSTPLEIFLDEWCEVGEDFRTIRSEIYKSYLDFCKQNNHTSSTRNVLYHFLRENGIGEVRGNGSNKFKMRVVPNKSQAQESEATP